MDLTSTSLHTRVNTYEQSKYSPLLDLFSVCLRSRCDRELSQVGEFTHRAKDSGTYGLRSSTQRLNNSDLRYDSKSSHRGCLLYLQPRAHLLDLPLTCESIERFPAIRALDIPEMECAGTGVPRTSRHAAMRLSSLLTNAPSHIRLSKPRVLVFEVSKITTPKNCAGEQRTRAFVLRAPARPRHETSGLLIAQP